MTVRVIQAGKTRQDAKCEWCGAIVRFGEADIKPQLLPDWLDEPHVVCPECDRCIFVNRPASTPLPWPIKVYTYGIFAIIALLAYKIIIAPHH